MTYERDIARFENMESLVTSERASMLNTGVVNDAEAQSLSLLKEQESAASEKQVISNPASLGANSKGIASSVITRISSKKADTGTVCPTDEGFHSKSESAGHLAALEINAKRMLFEEALAETDDSPELKGTKDVVSAGRVSKKLAYGIRGKLSGKEAIAAGKKTSALAAKKGTASAAGSASKAAYAKASQSAAAQASATVVKSASTKTIGAAIASALAPVAAVAAGIFAFVVCALAVAQIISALFGFWTNEANKQMISGLPPYVTYEMVEMALICQEEYGHPAGCTIAQIIAESGQGDHMSELATRDHNLFGMKWANSYAAAPEVSGKANWQTNEEYDGEQATITATFIVFKGDAECIKFRSRVFLQNSRWTDNPLIQEAISNRDSDKMAEGLKDAGWATDSSYVSNLKTIMDTYNLRRFDSMSPDDLKDPSVTGSIIVQAAYSQLGVPYVWGGESPGVGLDCSGLTQYCYRQAGISIPHYTGDQYDALNVIALSLAQPGDILYRTGHVAIYIGGDEYIHEPHRGAVCTKATGIDYFTCALTYREI